MKICSWCEQNIGSEFREHYKGMVFCSHEHTTAWREFHEMGIDVYEEDKKRGYTTTNSLKGIQ